MEESMIRPIMLAAAAALWLAGCATATVSEYVDLKTGQKHLCYRQAAFGVIPAVVSGSSYADCKTFLEGQGFVRRTPQTDAILRHVDPTLREALATPPASVPAMPPPDPATEDRLCRQRANASAGWDRARWTTDYYRCLAGH
jgi:hypothetical protein